MSCSGNRAVTSHILIAKKEMVSVNLPTFKGSSMVMKMTRALSEEGWSFIPNEFDVIIRAEHKASGETISFNSIGNLKNWLYRKALSY